MRARQHGERRSLLRFCFRQMRRLRDPVLNGWIAANEGTLEHGDREGLERLARELEAPPRQTEDVLGDIPTATERLVRAREEIGRGDGIPLDDFERFRADVDAYVDQDPTPRG